MNSNRLISESWCITKVLYPYHGDMYHVTCFKVVAYSTLTNFGHPQNQNCEQKGRGSESGNIYPLLLIASLITLRPL